MAEKIALVFDPDNPAAEAYVGRRLTLFNSSKTGRSDYIPATSS